MENKRKGKTLRNFWVKEKEYERLTDALSGNYTEEVLKIIYEIYSRGDL